MKSQLTFWFWTSSPSMMLWTSNPQSHWVGLCPIASAIWGVLKPSACPHERSHLVEVDRLLPLVGTCWSSNDLVCFILLTGNMFRGRSWPTSRARSESSSRKLRKRRHRRLLPQNGALRLSKLSLKSGDARHLSALFLVKLVAMIWQVSDMNNRSFQQLFNDCLRWIDYIFNLPMFVQISFHVFLVSLSCLGGPVKLASWRGVRQGIWNPCLLGDNIQQPFAVHALSYFRKENNSLWNLDRSFAANTAEIAGKNVMQPTVLG